MTIKKLIICSNDNKDWNGIYLKGEIERTMKELGNKPFGTDWMTWVLEHVFDEQLPSDIMTVITDYYDSLMSITIRLDDGEVTIKKA